MVSVYLLSAIYISLYDCVLKMCVSSDCCICPGYVAQVHYESLLGLTGKHEEDILIGHAPLQTNEVEMCPDVALNEESHTYC